MLAVRVDISFVNFSVQSLSLPFSLGTHGWERVSQVLRLDRPVAAVTISLLLRVRHLCLPSSIKGILSTAQGAKGHVCFDDVSLQEEI